MKRAVLTSPGRLVVQEAPVPPLAAGDALVGIRAVGVCGSDLHLFKEGSIGGITIADAGGAFVPGHECMGVVEDVGPGADRGLIGRRVFVEPAVNCERCRWCRAGRPNICPHHTFLGLPPRSGCLAEYLAHPARLCEPVPDELDDDSVVLLEPLAIAVHCLDRLGVTCPDGRPPDGPPGAAVVLGAGPLGLAHVMLLAGVGADPLVVTEVLDWRLELAGRLGATHRLNPRRDDVLSAVRGLTDGHGADLVIECAGEPETFAQMVELAAPGGRVGVAGIPVEDRLAFCHSFARRKELDVLMIRRANLTFARALDIAMRGRLPLKTLVTHHRDLARVQEAFEIAAEYRDGVVKTIVNP